MPTLNDLPKRPAKIALWGKPGTGKTVFVTSYGEGMQFLDCDNGLRSALTTKDGWEKERLKIDVVQAVETDPDRATAWVKTRDFIQSVYQQCRDKKYPFQVLAIDSMTALAEHARRYIISNSGKLNTSTPMTLPQRGLVNTEVLNLLVYITALPIPVVVILHSQDTSIGQGDKEIIYSEMGLPGKEVPRELPKQFDEILRMQVRQVQGKLEPYLQTIPDAFSNVRSRSNLVDGFRAALGFRKLLEQIN